MSTQFFLDEIDIEALAKLMLRSQQLRTREALCLRIGIDHRRLWFIKDSSDSDFVIQLINHLNEIGNKEALCKLCCEELFPIFCNSEIPTDILRNIAAKLHCNQELSNNYSNSSKTQDLTLTEVSTNGSIFGRGISTLVAGAGLVVFFGGGGLIYYLTSQSQQLPLGTYQATCSNISVNDGILTATCADLQGQPRKSSLDFKLCRYGIENLNGRLECKS
ncbi:hypothetical protein [Brasilonema sp. UFV-L1]|uniref:hypothetical protein n=1 Tax=Brasilonema sp. UFV-L1 TaxID=2234130 RepID=UPI00145CF3BD|nr:hypothetical protein [Brasilonema sp. UFV-L1]